MSEKKEAKNKSAAKAAPVVEAKKAKVDPALLVKRDEKGNKIMKVARGTERARRRVGLSQGWHETANRVANAPRMLPTKAEEVAQVTQAAAA